MHITLLSQADPDTVLGEGDGSLTLDSVKVWWVSPLSPGEEEYTFRNVTVEVDAEASVFWLTYTDDTDRNPRHAGRPANVVQRLERDFASPVAGPFLVFVS